MKKKLILILSMVVLCVSLFAISASAVSMDFISTKTTNVYEEIEDYECVCGRFVYSTDSGSTVICKLDYIYFRTKDSNDYISFIPAQFKKFVNTMMNSDNVSFSEFISFINSCDDMTLSNFGDGNALENLKSEYYGFNENYYNKIYFGEPVITQEDLSAKYEEGKTAGVTEYETETLPGLITAAKAEAVEDYEANTLPGLISEAVSDHKMSDEHKAELDAQLAASEELGKQSGYLLGHSDGYDEGFADGEAENKNGAPIAIVACLAILLPLVIAALIISSKKKKRII